MSEKANKTVITTRIIWILLGLFFLTTVISQIYIYFNNPLRLEVAQMYSTTESILFSGIYARNERVIAHSGSGVIAYTNPNGSKLAKNSIIAESYYTELDIAYQKQINEYNNQIRILKNAEALENSDNSQLESFNNQISNKHSQMMLMINQGDYSNISELKDDFLSLQCKKLIVRGNVNNYSEKITLIENMITNLNSRITGIPENVMIDESGYFVSVVDGYETKINLDNADKLTKEEIENIIKNPFLKSSENTIGKVIDDYKWCLIGIFDTERTRTIFEGAVVEFRIGSSIQTMEAVVKKITKLEDGSSIFIFECNRLSSDFVEKRVAQFQLLLNYHKGIRIPSSAINFHNNERGVYVKSGDEIIFKKVNVIKSEEDYVLVEDTTDLLGYISLYDNVVVSGIDLYEGKIIL